MERQTEGGKDEKRRIVAQPISKFEQDIYKKEGVSLTAAGDKALYGESKGEYTSHVRNIEEELIEDDKAIKKRQRQGGKQDVDEAFEEMKMARESEELAQNTGQGPRGDKDGEYRMQHRLMACSPERYDPFEGVGKEQKPNARSYYVKGWCDRIGCDDRT